VRSLSPFLQTSLIAAYFSLSGNTPEERGLLQIWVKGQMIKWVLNFRIFVGVSSYPYEALVFRDLIIILIS